MNGTIKALQHALAREMEMMPVIPFGWCVVEVAALVVGAAHKQDWSKLPLQTVERILTVLVKILVYCSSFPKVKNLAIIQGKLNILMASHGFLLTRFQCSFFFWSFNFSHLSSEKSRIFILGWAP